MTRHDAHPARAHALVLLAVFVLGGVAAPLVHRVQHGLMWAHLRGAASQTQDHCDHSRHDASYEHVVPTFRVDTCALCVHHVTVVFAEATAEQRLEAVGDSTSPPIQPIIDAAVAAFSIRGPPQLRA